MVDRIKHIEKWGDAIKKADALLFDLDGTLIDTDYANFLSYKEAVERVKKSSAKLVYDSTQRLNRTEIRKLFPDLSAAEFISIIRLKESLYYKHLDKTKLNSAIARTLDNVSQSAIVLVTNSRRARANMLLAYHNITDKFTHRYYWEDIRSINKFQYALSELNINPHLVVAFENDEVEIASAISAGMPAANIIQVAKDAK